MSTILFDLCSNLLAIIPESDTHWPAVRLVKDSVGFLLLPELERVWWEKLSIALDGFTPETELGRQVIGVFNLATDAKTKETRARS